MNVRLNVGGRGKDRGDLVPKRGGKKERKEAGKCALRDEAVVLTQKQKNNLLNPHDLNQSLRNEPPRRAN